MTAVSIPPAAIPPAPQPAMKAGSARSQSNAGGASAFEDQLQDAMQEGKSDDAKGARHSATGGDEKRESAKKKDSPTAPVAAVVPQAAAAQPVTPPAAFGLPSAGLEPGAEPGAETGARSKQDASVQSAIATHTPPVSLPVELPAPPVEAAHADPEAHLAFALRLTDQTPNARGEQAPPAVRQGALSTPAPSNVAPAARSAAGKASQAPIPGMEQTPSHAAEQSGSETGGNAFKDGSDDSKPAQTPATESKRQAGAAPGPETAALKEVPAQMPGPAPIVSVSAPIAPSASAPETSAAAVASAPQILAAAPAPHNPTSPVNDISVNVAVPGADAAGQQVAIRMVQRGEEIHVSVRTPDNQLAQSLRQDLGKLSTSLDQSGFKAESWRPVAAADSSAQSNSNPQRDAHAGDPNRDAPGSDARSGGNSGGSQEQKRRQQDDRPRWVAELEQQNNR